MEQYYYVNADNQSAGPVSPTEFAEHGISQETYVFCKGMTEWKKAGELPELAEYFAPSTPPVPEETDIPAEEPTQEESFPDYDYEERPSRHLGKIIFGMITSTFSLLYFLSFIVTIPLGILGIIFGAKATSAFDREDYAAARRFGKMCRGFSIPVMIIGIVSLVITVIFIGILISEC